MITLPSDGGLPAPHQAVDTPAEPPLALIVGPAGADDNNGNWRTARRWADLLEPDWRTRLLSGGADAPIGKSGIETGHARVLIALHARRSAAAIRGWSDAKRGPLIVVLTGTDLYHDIHHDAEAHDSLVRATRLVVLNEQGVNDLPAAFRAKARCILQSCPGTAPRHRSPRRLRLLMVGHLRTEKAPDTFFALARRLGGRQALQLIQIGKALDPALGVAAHALARQEPRYRYLGARSHAETLQRLRTAHVLVHPSRMEGGAHVVLEAVRHGTPVLASRIPGNVGMLGEDYAGYFPVGDADALLALIDRCRATQGAPDGFLAHLSAQCAARSPLFDPARERASLLELLDDCTKP